MRKQHIFLSLALLCMVASIILPLVYFEPATMGLGRIMNCCFVIDNGHASSIAPVGLLAITVVICPLIVWATFASKRLLANTKARVPNRKLQSKLCLCISLLIIAWYGYAIGVVFALKQTDTIRPQFAAVLPIIALILTLMARSGIKADEKLVRSADRLR